MEVMIATATMMVIVEMIKNVLTRRANLDVQLILMFRDQLAVVVLELNALNVKCVVYSTKERSALTRPTRHVTTIFLVIR